MSMPSWSLTARWIFPVDGPPLPSGVIIVANDKIDAVVPHGQRTADVDLGNVAIIPGLVNAHTHLDLTGLRGQCPPTPYFTQWLRGVIDHRRRQTPEQIDADIQTGIRECIAAGTTLVGDIAANGASWPALSDSPLRALVFHELLGLSHERAKKTWLDTWQWRHGRSETSRYRRGLSPHAPYSVNSALLRAAAWTGHPLAIHLAEAREELELLARHTGPFREFLNELGVWDPGGLAASVEEVMRRCRRSPRILYIHGNFLAPEAEIPSHATIVYCPRTHGAFGHPPHPFRDFLLRGVRVALGTDSLASNPDLSILAEMRFLHRRFPHLPADALLRMGTLWGAEALGWADETGSITPGKSADLVVVPLPDQEGDPHQLLFHSELPAERTLYRGQWR
jgi:aminodeoxyfutalosine deaminase